MMKIVLLVVVAIAAVSMALPALHRAESEVIPVRIVRTANPDPGHHHGGHYNNHGRGGHNGGHGHGHSSQGHGHSSRGHGHSSKGHGHSSHGHGYSNHGHGHSSQGHGYSNHGHGHSGHGHGQSHRGSSHSHPRGGPSQAFPIVAGISSPIGIAAIAGPSPNIGGIGVPVIVGK